VKLHDIQEIVKESEQAWLQRNNVFDAIDYQSFSRASITALEKVQESLQLEDQANIDINKHFDTPQPVDSCYVGREEEAKRLASCLFSRDKGQPQEQRRFVVQGLGGSGKTQFCCKFAQDHQHRYEMYLFNLEDSVDNSADSGVFLDAAPID
jgi:hypothetical protein